LVRRQVATMAAHVGVDVACGAQEKEQSEKTGKEKKRVPEGYRDSMR
jgi:hypothetical protein